MANDNSQSPRATRDNTNDPEAFAVGKVELEEYSGDDINSAARSLQGDHIADHGPLRAPPGEATNVMVEPWS